MKNKKSLQALVLSLGLITSCTTLNKKEIGLSYLENTAMLIQNSSLIYEDIFTYTKPAIEQFNGVELNPLAKPFQKRNEWNLLYASFVGATVLENFLAYKIDKNGNIAKIINGIIAVGEVFAIQHNSKQLMSAGWKENTSNINRYIEIFRINY